MTVVNASDKTKTVADPNAEYESMKPLWDKSRAICSGERFTKDLDGHIDNRRFTNLLIPFSPSMTQEQYDFYKAEAELPGIVSQFAKMLVGGLLRKTPILTLPDGAPSDAKSWIMDDFNQDDSSLIAFLDKALWEEMQTSRAWVYIDYPKIENADKLTRSELEAFKPFPVIWDADTVINWHIDPSAVGKTRLKRVFIRGMTESYEQNEFHPTYRDTVWVHELNDSGKYQIRVFKRPSDSDDVPVVQGQRYKDPQKEGKLLFNLEETITDIEVNGEALDFIPAWPLNGSIEIEEPILSPLIDKEVALYNKISRRNHLLYGAATYTPVIYSNMTDEDFDDIVEGGLGSWLHLGVDDKADILKTPTEALKDMESAIANGIVEIAKLGVRMLTPETSQSGVALEIRNASQTAQLGTLNTKVSQVLTSIIAFMLNWRYDLEYQPSDITFELSADFNPLPLGADWLRLATEWYQEGLIPRSIWLQLLKQNDMIDSDYDDEEGKKEINDDDLRLPEEDESLTKEISED